MGILSKVSNKAVFLDRDGVINKPAVIDQKPFPPSSLKELEILPGVIDGIKKLSNAGYKVFVVTNQPDVGRGKTTLAAVEEINTYLQDKLNIDKVYCCYHGGDEDCDCRKPKPGMLTQAATEWDILLQQSYIIGDRWRDIDAGRAAGVKCILIDYNYDEQRSEPDYTCTNFTDAVNYILKS